MATCKLCGKWGLFLKLSESGLCPPCYVQFGMDLESSNRIMNESINLIENSKNLKTRLSRCDDFMRHASILARYESKGISTTTPPPSELIRRVQARKEEITREQEANIAAACPYCAVSLQHVPKRRTACPSCSRPILVRKGKLCTEDEGRALDWCSGLGMDASKMYRIQKNLSEKFGRVASYTEAAWQLNWQLKQEGIRAGLAKYKEDAKAGELDLGDWNIVIIGGGSCPVCSPWNGRRFTFEEFERIMPLPIAECTHEKTADNPRGWCRCAWGLARKDGKGIFEQLRAQAAIDKAYDGIPQKP